MHPKPKSSARPSVSIIIPVFNKCDLTLQCLQHLAQRTSSIPHEIIVVDNASSDATPTRIPTEMPKVRYLRQPVNLNFAGACNAGAQAARAPLLLFLNNDTIPLDGWLEPLLQEVKSHPNVVAVGSRLLYESQLIQHAGIAFSRDARSPYHPYRLLPSTDPRVNHRRELQAVTAACILIRADAFLQCHGFDELFRNGYEDLDLCLRLRQRGGSVVYQPRSTLIHLESQTPGRMRHDNDNRRRFFHRWQHAVLSDEDAFFAEDHCRIARHVPSRPEAPILVRFQNEPDRRAWQQVAQTQLAAARFDRAQVLQLLAQTDAWPTDGPLRRWAGALAHRLADPSTALQHFQASRQASPDPELTLILPSPPDSPPVAPPSSPAPDGSTVPNDAWQQPFQRGLDELLSDQAREAMPFLESALALGAPVRLILPALRQSSSLLRCPDASLIEHALSHLLHFSEHHATKDSPSAPHPVPPPSADTQAPALTSILILAHNQLATTQACLESLRLCTPEPHEIILVDNGSTDGTASWFDQLATDFDHIHVIHNATNLGFAAANNQALSLARGSFVVLLNNDTILTPGWLSLQLEVFDRHPQTGIVGPRSNRVAGEQLVDPTGYLNLKELPEFAQQWARSHHQQSRPVPRVIGFCLVARQSVIQTIGGLDEQFGSGNFEDDDFCLRARFAGFEIRIADDAFVHHIGSQTFQAAGINHQAAMERNWSLFKSKWGFPAEQPLGLGYRVPASLPHGLTLHFPLPTLSPSHPSPLCPRLWHPISPSPTPPSSVAPGNTPPIPSRPLPPPTSTSPLKLPECARLGHLADARCLLHQRRWPQAWSNTLAALEHRPFHPEAFLLLAEIARAAGDVPTARRCAHHARSLTPHWKPVRKFLQKLPDKSKGTSPDWMTLPPSLPPQSKEPSHPAPTPRLSVCLIVKNEEQFLARCLDSIRPLAHQIVVVDTGSTDRTIEIARSFGAEVHAFTWCDDFSAARNAALLHARGDWVLSLDADEELPADQHDRLRAALHQDGILGTRLPLVNVGAEADGQAFVPRLFRNAPGLFYVSRVHEQVFPSILVRAEEWGLKTNLGDAVLRHYGYSPELIRQRGKDDRNLQLLRQAVEEIPGDANLLMNLGLELHRAGEIDAALQAYQDAFQALATDPAQSQVPELRETLLTQFATRLLQAGRFDEVERILTSPVASTSPLSASLHFSLGLARLRLRQPAQAAESFRQCLATRTLPTVAPVNPEIHRAGPYHALAQCFLQLGQPEIARESLQQALAVEPDALPVHLDLARLDAQQGQPVPALQNLHQLIDRGIAPADVWHLGAEIALSHPDLHAFALDWTREAVHHHPKDPALAAQMAEALLYAGDPASSLIHWRRSLETLPAPVLRAALALCEITQDSPPTRIPPEEEPAVSAAFLQWYQRLVPTSGSPVLLEINRRLHQLEPLLPTASRGLRTALAEAA